MNLFPVKSKTSVTGTTVLKCWIISIYELSDIGLKICYCTDRQELTHWTNG